MWTPCQHSLDDFPHWRWRSFSMPLDNFFITALSYKFFSDRMLTTLASFHLYNIEAMEYGCGRHSLTFGDCQTFSICLYENWDIDIVCINLYTWVTYTLVMIEFDCCYVFNLDWINCNVITCLAFNSAVMMVDCQFTSQCSECYSSLVY